MSGFQLLSLCCKMGQEMSVQEKEKEAKGRQIEGSRISLSQ